MNLFKIKLHSIVTFLLLFLLTLATVAKKKSMIMYSFIQNNGLANKNVYFKDLTNTDLTTLKELNVMGVLWVGKQIEPIPFSNFSLDSLMRIMYHQNLKQIRISILTKKKQPAALIEARENYIRNIFILRGIDSTKVSITRQQLVKLPNKSQGECILKLYFN
ncbi:MAG: hypothetical protein ACLQQ4_00510 [Bacteroidia bacterium]